MNNAGLPDGLYFVERAPGEWHPVEIDEGLVFWLQRKPSILTAQTMRNAVRGPLVKPGTKP